MVVDVIVAMVTEEKSMLMDDSMVPDHPEVVVFASYSGPPKYPVRISVLGEMVSHQS